MLVEVCRRIVEEWDFSFAGLIVEEGATEWQLRYAFYGEREAGWVHVLVSAPLARTFSQRRRVDSRGGLARAGSGGHVRRALRRSSASR